MIVSINKIGGIMPKEKIKILHSADFHLGSPFKFLDSAKRKTVQEAQLNSFYEILKIAKKYSVDFLIIAGDLFDSVQVDNLSLQRVFEGFQTIPEIKIIINAGNHDYWHINSYWNKFEELKNVYLFDPETLYFEFPEWNITFWGKAFTGQSALYNLWKDADELVYAKKRNHLNVLVQHGDILNHESHYNPISIDWIDKLGFDLVQLGHIHNIIEPYYTSRKIPCLYNGCVQGRDFDETGKKGAQLIEIDNNSNKISMTFLPIYQIYFDQIQLDVSNLEQEDNIRFNENIMQKILSDINIKTAKLNLYQLILIGNVSKKINLNLLTKKLEPYFFYLEIQDQTKIKFNYKELLQERSLRGDISRYAKKLAVQPDLLSQVLDDLGMENLPLKDAMRMIEQAYYYTMQAEEQDIDIYEN